MVKINIGIVNALIRITCGLMILAWATAKMTRWPWRDSYLFIAMLAAMKVAEGITRFCPITALFEKYQQEQAERVKGDELTINPT
ncbi:YgaP family membrane protein [Thermaerobacillus caldiproteolyticus]|uniref:Inner membrane protein YgaP-like transmembrane domain-containing protein n=1 Tax=Thermaerobacillus caldiproteolyticus TaxID=247480 RepID=A0A7V9ZA35_9BACL|nr:DUF2892 domain-containing protein [Anoxybacillus caldiproteolyticus]MBA2876844.1 hypothetical protein [Anoxybacillus caldiproteolyticus]QPA31219.1 DUF2892 domain-containing protein [Anoxybacillus caldiproteolyticus]